MSKLDVDGFAKHSHRGGCGCYHWRPNRFRCNDITTRDRGGDGGHSLHSKNTTGRHVIINTDPLEITNLRWPAQKNINIKMAKMYAIQLEATYGTAEIALGSTS